MTRIELTGTYIAALGIDARVGRTVWGCRIAKASPRLDADTVRLWLALPWRVAR